MEAMLGIFLYSYLYLQLAKPPCVSYCLLCFLFKIWRTRGWNRFFPASGGIGGRRREEVTQTIYTHVSKCKNGKIKE
jgi:hypothetical protein